MKILHVISDRNIGGAGVLLCNLLRHMDRSRIESVVAIPRGSALGERLSALQIPVRELKHPCDRLSPLSVWEIEGILRRESFGGVHANAALAARVAGKRCGLPVVHTRHCCFPLEGVWRSFALRRLGGAWNRRLSDRVIATAEAAAEDLVRLGIPRERIAVILNGSDAVREVSCEELADFRRTFAIPEDAFTVGLAARLVPCKGHAVLLRAARLLCERMPDRSFVFLLAGEGPMRPSLIRLAEKEGIADRVRFLGFLADMAPFYRALRVNVNCSEGTETSCLALSEGMSASLYIIHIIVKIKYLSSAVKLTSYGTVYNTLVILQDIGLDTLSASRGLVKNGHIAYSADRHTESSRYRCGAERQNIHVRGYFLYFFLLRYAKALFLIYNEKPKILKLHITGQ